MSVALTTALGIAWAPAAQAATVAVPDAVLAKCMKDALARLDPPASGLTTVNMARITDLSCDGVENLTGVGALTGATELAFWYGEYTDLRPLAKLTNLEVLTLETFRNAGKIAGPGDLSALAGLSKLRELGVYNTKVSSLKPLAKLTGLESLTVTVDNAGGGLVKDLAPLSGLTNLTYLNLYGNQISNLGPLAKLSRLAYLDVSWNKVANLAPLSGLTHLATLYLDSNRISDLRPVRAVRDVAVWDQEATLRITRGVATQFPLFWKDGSQLKPKLPSGLKLSGGKITGSKLGTFKVKFAKGDGFAGTLTITVAKPGVLKPVTPKITGTVKVGKTLTAKPGTWKPGTVQLSYQWYRSGKKISKATKPTHTLVAADQGKKITVKVTGKRTGYAVASKTSKATAKVKLGTLTTAVPAIVGTPAVGETLAAVPGKWGPKPVKLSYQWYRSGKKIPKATKSTYTLVAADKGKKITVKVTATKPGYTKTTKTSAATKAT